MKKIVIFSMIIMPIILLFIITTSGTIIQSLTYIYVDNIEFVETNLVLNQTTSDSIKHKLKYNIFPTQANNKNVRFWSDNENIVTVDENGVISSVDFGETYVYICSAENNNKISSCKVIVSDDKIHSVTINNKDDFNSVFAGQTISLITSYWPNMVVNPNLIFQSSNTNLARVSSSGKVQFLDDACGEVTISVFSEVNPEIKDYITCFIKTPIKNLYIDDISPITIGTKTYLFPEIKTTPSNVDVDLEFSSNNTAIANVNEDGLVEFLKDGEVIITASARDQDFSVSKSIYSTFGYITNIYFDNKIINLNLDDFKLDNKFNLLNYTSLTVLPNDIDKDNISFSSSNENIISVSGDNFFINNSGSAVITITANSINNSKIFDNCSINVFKQAENILVDSYFEIYSPQINLKDIYTLNPSNIYPNNQEVFFEIVGGDSAQIVKNILSFSNEGEVDMKIYLKENPSIYSTFKVKYITNVEKILLTESSSYLLKSNCKYYFEYEENIVKANFSSYPFISSSGNIFISSCGAEINNLQINDLGLSRYINLIFTEPVLDISFVTQPDKEIYTSKKSVDIENTYVANTYPLTARHESGKYVVAYDYNIINDCATVSNGIINFTMAGEVEITIYIPNSILQYSFKVKSSFEKIDSFDLFYKNSNIISNNYQINVGDKIYFSATNFLPSDCEVNLESFKIITLNSSIVSVKKFIDDNNVKFEISGLLKGVESVIIETTNSKFVISLNINLLVSDFNMIYKSQNLTSFETYDENISLYIEALPNEANNKAFTASINNGGIIQQDNSKLDITFNNYDTYTLTLSSVDGNTTKCFNITYLENIINYSISCNNNSKLKNNETLNLKYNENLITFNMSFSSGIATEKFYNDFLVSSTSNKTSFYVKDYEIVIKVPESTDSMPVYEDTITINYQSNALFNFNVSRIGISRVEFTKHDNNDATDLKGLQKIRVFGKKSYYDGKAQSYYLMPVKIYLVSGNEAPSSVAQELIKKINWTTSSKQVSVGYNESMAKITFSKFVGNTLDDIKNDIFDKKATVYAKNAFGETLAQYTFVVLDDAVNVFDEEGLKKCTKVVLHTNFGEDLLSENTAFIGTEKVTLKVVYGNGYTINFNSINNTVKSGEKAAAVTYNQAINVHLKGCNPSTDTDDYHVPMNASCNTGGVSTDKFMLLYSYISNAYHGTYASSDGCIKNSMLYSNKEDSLHISSKTARNVYLENISVFDGGHIALNIPNDNLYLKGYIGVYNFKNKNSFKTDLNLPFMATANKLVKKCKEEGYVETVNGEDWANSVILCIGERKIFFYDSETDSYIQAKEGNKDSADGFKEIVSVNLLAQQYYIWATPAKEGYPSYYDEYNADGTINENFRNLVEQKISRKI